MRAALITDSTCDLPQDLLYQYNIRQVSSKVVIDGKIRYDNFIEFNREQFYLDLSQGKKFNDIVIMPPTADEFLQTYRKICLDYDVVISIHESSKFSDTIKHARQAAIEGADAFKKMRLQKNIGAPFQIRIIDSKNTSIGLGLLVLRTAELLSRDISATKLANDLEDLADHLYLYMVPQDVGFLRNAKKVISTSLLGTGLASLTDTKPILLAHRGEISTLDKKRGFDSAVSGALQSLLAKLKDTNSYDKVGIAYGGNAAVIESLSRVTDFRVELAGTGLGSVLSTLAPNVGLFLGHGALGFALLNKDVNITTLFNRPS